MIQEPYKGRKLKVVKDRNGGLVGSINGQPMPAVYGGTGQDVIDQFHRFLGDRASARTSRNDRMPAFPGRQRRTPK